MIDWPKVVQDLEKENARLKKDIEKQMREFGMEVAMKVLETQSWALLKSDDLEQIVDEVMEKNT